MRFKVKDHDTWYAVEIITPRQAEHVGCTGATVRIIGPRTRTIIYGAFENVGETETRVPGSSGITGHRATFRAWNDQGSRHDNLTMEGHIVT